MRRVVFKYELKVGDTKVRVPIGSIVRYIGTVNNRLFVWIEQYKQEQELTEDCFKELTFEIYGTGWDFSDSHDRTFVGTTVTQNGFVWHVYQNLG